MVMNTTQHITCTSLCRYSCKIEIIGINLFFFQPGVLADYAPNDSPMIPAIIVSILLLIFLAAQTCISNVKSVFYNHLIVFISAEGMIHEWS